MLTDAYAECYPSYYEYAGTVVDSDDEEGGARREGADKGVGLSRSDFGSEEEYKEYLAANPQRAAAAAGGGGGGKGDARRAQVGVGRVRGDVGLGRGERQPTVRRAAGLGCLRLP
jgi:hypothetical protein